MFELVEMRERRSLSPSERTIVVLPTYNERDNLKKLIPIVMKDSRFDILVVDDNSPDGTSAVVEELKRAYPGRIHLNCRSEKLGLGTAYIEAFNWALARDYQIICQMDSDFSHDPKVLPHLVDALGSADVVIGSRYVPGGKTVNWSAGRRMLSRFGSAYARTILGLKYHDLTGGFKCFRRKVLESIDLNSIDCTGYAFQIEMTYRAHQLGYKIIEIPITFRDRQVGNSKMDSSIVAEALVRVWMLRMTKPEEVPFVKGHATRSAS